MEFYSRRRRNMYQEQKPFVVAVAIFIVVASLFFLLLIALNACTVSMTMNHSKAGGSTQLDEDQATTPTVNPNVNIPISAIPKAP